MKQFEEAKEESKRAAAETERLLQLVQMSQEEQNSKEKTIMDLQQ
jgi:golgin subfamily B member 1